MSLSRSFIVAAVLMLAALPLAARADTIAVIGTGEVASAFGPRLAAVGHTVVYGSRSPGRADVRELVEETGGNASAATPSEAAAQADLVMLAVPWDVAEQVTLSLGDLSGKIVVDPTNARIVGEDGFRRFASHTSNAERIQNAAPRAFVVKALNTISRDSMIDPDFLGPITIPIAGDDAAAKQAVAELIEALGYEAIDVGPLQFAHVIEGLYLLRANSRDLLGTHFEYHFRVRETPVPQAIR